MKAQNTVKSASIVSPRISNVHDINVNNRSSFTKYTNTQPNITNKMKWVRSD